MRELKRGGAPGSRPETPPSVGKPDEVANKATNDNLKPEDEIVKRVITRILNASLAELEGLSYEDWTKVLNPGKLEHDIQRLVKDEIQKGGYSGKE